MGAFDAYMRLSGTIDGTVLADEPMARHTTYRIGGPAALFVECNSVSALSLTCEVLAEEGVEWTVVGKGSNLLVADAGCPGAVIELGGQFDRMDFADAAELAPGAEAVVRAGGAVSLSRLVQKAFNLGLSGLEFAVGTPGSVGGAVAMNAGTPSAAMDSVVDSVTTFRPGGGLAIRHAGDIAWGYRTSGLEPDEVVVEAALRLKRSDKMMLHAAMEARLKERKATQPLNQASCGSVFRNPEGDSAARLIESCGIKGVSRGGARISDKHANFIVNTGSATAADVLYLIDLARKRVREVHGIELQTEVVLLGF